MLTDLDAIDWNTATREAVIDESPFVVYAASKALAEKALWDFAEQHDDIQVTTRTSIVCLSRLTGSQHYIL
jgi:nucleoside-diphosphate-sugar epimerase